MLNKNQKYNQTGRLKFSIVDNARFLNAGKGIFFVYEISGFTPTKKEINNINKIETKSKIKDRVQAIKMAGGKFKFKTLEQPIFKNNLVLIDSLLPNILAEITKIFFLSTMSSIRDLTESVNKSNPLNFDTQFAHTFYEYKVKRFLTDVALGMTPSKVWTGIYDATGGYLIVKENGDVLCYHIYNRNQFEDYLFANTKLETASSTRHDFAKMYEVDGKFYFKMNLQIRFK
jgi:hypothetical protein